MSSFNYITKFHQVDIQDVISIIFSFNTENDIVLFSAIENNLEYESIEDKEFINKNKLYKSNQWIFPEEVPGNIPNIIWYKTKGREDIKRAIEIESLFRCIILPKGLDIVHFNYLIYIIEDYEGPVLCVYDKTNNFNDKVLPKIQPYLGDCRISKSI
ncbi:hypothetical protein AWM68_17640 [Fictibacillus phosphorivorans]|uniref:Uncharacterized protein n=1 Tax=Fictibacillus phosphorivorans TaxID=1221500 RepID=A0A163S259_9BACL|nr:hypothetical protein [Fictibacillus phosphorivorans]KZE67994.1 hypothetical protein AWM68_17640 [Fictibacillus phosphorivorans]